MSDTIALMTESPTVPTHRPSASRQIEAWILAVAAGALAVLIAGAWWLLSRPGQEAVRTAEIMGGPTPHAAVVGPAVLAIAGAFVILLGVILRGQRRTTRSECG